MPTEFTSENWILGASGGYGTPSLLSENEAHITRGSYIQSRVHYSAPIDVTAELKADDEECFTMSLFHTQTCTGSHCTAKNAGLSWENGGWGDMLRFFPGDYRETVGGVTSWHVARLSLDSLGTANFYWNGQLKYTTTYPATSTGPLQFIGGCIGFRVRNLNVASSAEGSSTSWMFDDTTIRTAVAAWLSDSAAAEATYGHISTWETGGVTDMSFLFCGYDCVSSSWCSDCNTAAVSFNEDISAWDTSGVTSMETMFALASAFNQDLGDWPVHSVTDMNEMFLLASAFNQDIGDWAVHNVKNMSAMFYYASSFNQDLGWCLDEGVNFDFWGYSFQDVFYNTPCASTSCGVVQMDNCPTPAPTYAPTLALTVTSGASSSSGSGGSGGADVAPIFAGVAAAAVLIGAVGALWFYRRSKGSETEPGGGVDSPPPLVPLKARPEGEAPEAEEILPAQPVVAARGWFTAEPEGESMVAEHEPASFAPEASSLPPGHVSGAEAAMMAAGEPPPQPRSWSSGAAPEPEPEFEPEPEC